MDNYIKRAAELSASFKKDFDAHKGEFMLTSQTKDVQFCVQGKHIVPREEMTKMLSDNGKAWRMVCISCKETTLEHMRENRKQTKLS